MAMTNAEKQARHRERRDELAAWGKLARDGDLAELVETRLAHEAAKPHGWMRNYLGRGRAVQALLQDVDPADHQSAVKWLQAWLRRKPRKSARV
jgi:hypothetical protein